MIIGPPHKPIFTMSLEIDGKQYKGTGANKKIAKNNCARPAIIDLRVSPIYVSVCVCVCVCSKLIYNSESIPFAFICKRQGKVHMYIYI